MKKELSLSSLFKAMLKKAWLIVALALVFAAVSYVVAAYYTVPQYTSNTKVYVRNAKTGSLSSSDLDLSRNLLNGYIEVLVGNNMLQLVADELNELRLTEDYNYLRKSDYSIGQIKSMIKATPGNDTEIITINVTSTNPKEAKLVNLLLLKHFPDEIKRVINTGEAKELYEPTLPTAPSSPNISKKTLTGALIGFAIAVAIIFLLFLTDSAIHSEADLTEAFDDISILGVIPTIQSKDSQVYSSVPSTQKKRRS